MNSNVHLNDDSTNDGFLSVFVERSVEMPSDGKNGDCIVCYKGEHINCKLQVKLSNGVREGIGTIMKDGAPFIQIEYHHGVPNGPLCRMDDCGMVDLRGQLMNGKECGLFLEYDGGIKVVWRGYYRNGVRYSEVVASKTLDGYYDEKSVVKGILLTTAQYDKDLKDKNGRCFEYDNGRVRSECVYENGVKKHTVREFVDGKMRVFDSSGKKVYEGMWFGDMKSGFLCHEPMEGMDGFFKEVDSSGQLIAVSQYDELNVHKNGKCYELENGKVKRVCDYENGRMKRVVPEWELCHMILSRRIDSIAQLPLDPSSFSVSDIQSGRTVGVFQLNRKYCSVYWFNDTLQSVVVDMDSKEMFAYVNSEQIDTQCSIGLIDLDVNGRRWEGGVKDGIPFGYGVLYDEEGRKEYEGFMMDGMKVCYGIDYYSDIGIVQYEGCYCNNEYYGKGVHYYRNREIDYDGVWKNNLPYWPPYDDYSVNNHTKSMDVPNNSCNDLTSFILHSFIHSLKRIVIGNDCYGSVRLFELDGLIELESVVIGQNSCTIVKNLQGYQSDERTDGVCRIVNCPKVKSIQINSWSFCDYHSLELHHLPSLESIDIGMRCFYWAPSFSLTDLPQLKSVKLGQAAFIDVQSVVFENLPKLQSITLGNSAFKGDGRDDRQTIAKPPYNYKNTLTMRNLSSLTSFKGNGYNFRRIGSVYLGSSHLLID